ncbi:hypothetical protein EJ07DRAFT_179560 [Lizonia empirigonia]|nr:hypothetical protein EJ07DRAFT_179560 [Lizonia empirigonia]
MGDAAARQTPSPPTLSSPARSSTRALPWAHAAAYGQHLTSATLSVEYTSHVALTRWLSELPSAPPEKPHTIEICPVIARYPDKKHKDACIKRIDPEVDDVEEYKAGATIASATKQWRKSRPTIGLVCSKITAAHVKQDEGNKWHMVALATANSSEIFVHDPNFDAAAYTSGRKSFKDVRMNPITQLMLQKHFIMATEVWLQGPPSDYDRDLGECMGCSAQWLEATVTGKLPWPPNSTAAGGEWHRLKKW